MGIEVKAKYQVGEILNCRGKVGRITEIGLGYPNGAENEMMCYYLEIIGENDEIFNEPRTEVFAISYADRVFKTADPMAQILFNNGEEQNE